MKPQYAFLNLTRAEALAIAEKAAELRDGQELGIERTPKGALYVWRRDPVREAAIEIPQRVTDARVPA